MTTQVAHSSKLASTKPNISVGEWLLVFAVLAPFAAGFGWLALHEITDALDLTKALLAGFSLGALGWAGLAWLVVLDRFQVPDLFKKD
jgi:hypothetical protein